MYSGSTIAVQSPCVPVNGWNEMRNVMGMSWCDALWMIQNELTCTRTLGLDLQVLLFLTSGLLQLALIAVVFPV